METFVVQVWARPDDASCGGALRGRVRHVATGTEAPFRDDREVLALLRVATHPPLTRSRDSDGDRRPLSGE